MKRTVILSTPVARQTAHRYIDESPAETLVTLSELTRTLEQNAKFHAICSDFARAGFEWAGKKRTAEQIKVLLVSGHATATKEGAEMIPGLEGEFVNIRESTALMSKRRGASLLESAQAMAAMHGIRLSGDAG